jgi:hypothetical protein
MIKTCKLVVVGIILLILGMSVALAEDEVYVGINSRNQIEAYLSNKIKGISVHVADGIFAIGREYRQDNKEFGIRLGWQDTTYEENVPIIDLMLANYFSNWRIGIQLPINVDIKNRPIALSISFKI